MRIRRFSIRLTGGYDETTIVWDLTDSANPVRRATLTGHTGSVSAAALSADGRTALTGSADARTVSPDETAIAARMEIVSLGAVECLGEQVVVHLAGRASAMSAVAWLTKTRANGSPGMRHSWT